MSLLALRPCHPAREQRPLSRSRTAVFAGLAVFCSALDALPSLGIPGRTGWHLGALFAVLFILGSQGAIRKLLSQGEGRPTLFAGLLITVSYASSILVAAQPGRSAWQLMKVGLVLSFALALAAQLRAGARPELARSLGTAAVALVAVTGLVGLFGLLPTPLSTVVFEQASPHASHSWPRLRGLCSTPGGLGVLMISSAGLASFAKPRRVALLTPWLALLLALMTLAFSGIAAGIAGLHYLLRARPRLAWSISLTLALLGAAILYVQPLSVTVAGHRYEITTLSPAWHRDGLGQRYHPVSRVAVGPLEIEQLPRSYQRLHQRAVNCFLEHPLLGVGGRNFRQSCSVMLLNTRGRWYEHSRSHSEYFGLLAQQGLVGLLAFLFFVATLRKRARVFTIQPHHGAVLLASLYAGLAGELFFQLPFAAWLTLSLADSPTGERTAEPESESERANPGVPGSLNN